jgi:cellulose synthase/poly-beta-1,6-N-acetylglucosamine synthase-like glycosyltransferase
MDAINYVYIVMFFFGIYFLLLFILLYIKNKNTIYDYPKPEKFPIVSIIVPAYNEQDSIAGCIQCLLEIDYPKNKKEIIIVSRDNIKNNRRICKNTRKRLLQLGKTIKGIEIAKLFHVADADSASRYSS